MLAFSLSVILSLVLSLSLCDHASANSHMADSSLRKRHVDRAPNVSRRNVTGRDGSLDKRFDGARFTFYSDGLGACGKTNSPGDFIVALNSAQYDGGSHCFEMITITVNGKSTQAQIVDECPGCPFSGLDFSQGLFTFFAPTSVGVLTGSWNFGNGDPQPSQSTTTSATTTSTPPPSPTTTSTTTSQSEASSSIASSSSAISSSSASSSSVTSTSASTVANVAPLASAVPAADSSQLNSALLGIVGLIASFAQ